MSTRAFRFGAFFGLGIVVANLLLQFGLTPVLPWQVIGALSIGAWIGGVVGAGAFAGRDAPMRTAAVAAVVAAAFDLVRGIAVDLVIGVPASQAGHLVTPGMAAAASLAEFAFIAPLAAGIGVAAARLAMRGGAVPQAGQ